MEQTASREINYLRISITDRCQLRCFYCTYWQDWQKLPPGEILSYEELLRVAGIAAKLGIRKVRVTGGEPLVRRGIVSFIRSLHKVPGIEEVCLTTNGVRLQELAPDLYEAGLRHLNLSLDTLKRDRYRDITGRDNLPAVLAGLELADSLGFHPLKINCVVLKGINEDELLKIALLAKEHPFQVRFIELMPTISGDRWTRHYLPMSQVRRHLAALGPLKPLSQNRTAGPARIFRLAGFRGELGFISPMSEHHCATCNRLRLTAAGKLKPCLLSSSEIDLKGPLRQEVHDNFLAYLFHEAIHLKALKAGFPFPPQSLLGQSMVSIGG